MTLGGPCPGIRDGTQKRSPREVREIAEIGETSAGLYQSSSRYRGFFAALGCRPATIVDRTHCPVCRLSSSTRRARPSGFPDCLNDGVDVFTVAQDFIDLFVPANQLR
jgi:hypothetical protein